MKAKNKKMFEFKKDYILKNNVVEISPLTEEHIEPLYKESLSENIWKYFLENGTGKENFVNYILSAIQKRKDGIEYPFVIKDLRLNEYAGVTRIYDLNNELKILKIGHTWIGERFQGTGLNKNCKFLLFEFLFDELKIERIGFGASSENIKSINAMRSIGCKQEGILRSFMPGINGKDRVDIVLMSILKNEWTSKIKEELKRKI